MTLTAMEISANELAASLGTPDFPRIFDVRRRDAFDAADSIIAGARWRDHRHTDEWGAALPNPADVVVYCVHGHQVSQGAAAALRARGLNARYLEGGIDAFAAAGGITLAKTELLPANGAGPSRWIVRARPTIDDLACLWFVRRFVDRDAEMLFVSADRVREVATELDAIALAFGDGDGEQNNDACRFTHYLDAFEIENAALGRLARIVHAAGTAECEKEREAAGVRALWRGLAMFAGDARVMTEHGMLVFDALFAWAKSDANKTQDHVPKRTAA